MTDAATTPTVLVPQPSATPSSWVRLFRRRIRERAFWEIQALVVSVTALHLTLEAFDVWEEVGLHHLAVVLYLVPVVYAGLRYGLEGSVLTGAWAFVLMLPNIFLWHRRPSVLAGELLRAIVVLGVGIAASLPVERERRQRRRLEETSRRLALLNHIASALVFSTSLDRTISTVLRRLREVLGLDAAAVLSWDPDDGYRPLGTWWDPPGGARPQTGGGTYRAELRALGDGVTPLSGGTLATPLGPTDASGGALLVVPGAEHPLGSADRVLLAAVAGQVGVALDNARLNRREKDRLRSYVVEVTKAQEEERKHIARELHDTAAQDLVRLCRKLDALAESEAGPDAASLEKLRALAGEILENLRRVSRDLRPTMLEDLGLAAALEWLAWDLTQRTDIRSEFRCDGAPCPRLPQDVELTLFRIAQEALSNVEKHAEASVVLLEMSFAPRSVRLLIRDDGLGFDGSASGRRSRNRRLGLLGMEERASLVGGTLEIRANAGGGTRVLATVPLGEPDEGAGGRGADSASLQDEGVQAPTGTYEQAGSSPSGSPVDA